MSGIGLLNEGSLHSSLKEWYSTPDDILEVPVDGYVVDIVRGSLLVEIQTAGFHAIRTKLRKLLASHEVLLVHPIPLEKWIIKLPRDGESTPARRKSPKRGRVEDLFMEMVSIPRLFMDPNLSVEVLLTREEEVRSFHGRKGWRRNGWVVDERRLLEVVGRRTFREPRDWLELLPDGLGEFTTGDLAREMGIRRNLAQKFTYCMRRSDLLKNEGKRGRSNLYSVHAEK